MARTREGPVSILAASRRREPRSWARVPGAGASSSWRPRRTTAKDTRAMATALTAAVVSGETGPRPVSGSIPKRAKTTSRKRL
ncbi:hypothetical protein HR12_36460 [Microbacterium sp. SUBG005]|nr:hypothetical protein HR12_36460 [Microbacterium sp. SUBG005]